MSIPFRVLWIVDSPAGPVTVATEPRTVDAPLADLLRQLADRLDMSHGLAVRFCGVHIEEDAECKVHAAFAGKVEPCGECGEDYPQADLHIHGHVFCSACRVKDEARKAKKGGS